MEKKETVSVVEFPVKHGNTEHAERLRDYADKIERGEIDNFFFLGSAPEENDLYSFTSFPDRIKMLGALEYMKLQLG